MDVQEPEIKGSHAVEHLEIEEPEHTEDEECSNEISDRKDRGVDVPDKGYGSLDRAGGGNLDIPDHQGHSEGIDAVRETFKIDFADRFFDWHSRIPSLYQRWVVEGYSSFRGINLHRITELSYLLNVSSHTSNSR